MRFGAGELTDPYKPPEARIRIAGDWRLRDPSQQAAIKIARLKHRAAMEDEAARTWWDLVEAELGPAPAPDDAQAWWDRATAIHELSLQAGWGSNVGKLAGDYAEHCRQTAAVANSRYRKTGQVQVEVTVATLSQRLAEGRARAIDGSAKRLPTSDTPA